MKYIQENFTVLYFALKKATNHHVYAIWLKESIKVIEELEKFMFQDHMKSLDAPITSGEERELFHLL